METMSLVYFNIYENEILAALQNKLGSWAST